MADGQENFSHQFKVKLVKVVGVPEVHNVLGPLDQHQGLLVTLNRLKGESNASYKQRILDVYVNQGAATYGGLINGITRELGLTQLEALKIDAVRNLDGSFVSEAPRITIDSTEVVLYNKWRSSEDYSIDRVIPIYNTTDTGFTLDNLVAAINESPYFLAEILPGVDGTRRSVQLLLQDSTQTVSSEVVPPASSFKVKFPDLLQGSVFFSEIDTFITEVALDNQVLASPGNYFVDYKTGRVHVRGLPAGGGTVRYAHMQFPFRAKASDVILQKLFDEKLKKELFEQVQLNTGEFVNGLPKSDTVDLINELISVKGVYWGK